MKIKVKYPFQLKEHSKRDYKEFLAWDKEIVSDAIVCPYCKAIYANFETTYYFRNEGEIEEFACRACGKIFESYEQADSNFNNSKWFEDFIKEKVNNKYEYDGK